MNGYVHGRRARRVYLCKGGVGGSLISTVPLLGSLPRFEIERADQVERGGAERHATDTGPQVDHIAFLAAAGVKAVKDVLFQVHAEGAATTIAAVDRAGPAALGAAAMPGH